MSETAYHITTTDFDSKTWEHDGLMIVDIRNTPPHIGLVNSGVLWHLTHQKMRHDDVAGWVKQVQRVGIPCVFLEFNRSIPTLDVITAFENYKEAGPGVSCLSPIIDTLAAKLNLNGVELLFDLIDALERQHWIKTRQAVNIEGHEVEIKRYTKEDLQQHLENLKHSAHEA